MLTWFPVMVAAHAECFPTIILLTFVAAFIIVLIFNPAFFFLASFGIRFHENLSLILEACMPTRLFFTLRTTLGA
jgi:hypothetical protein